MTVHNPRQLKALAILSSGIDAIKRVNDRKWLVKSQHTDSYYEVQRKSHTPWECSCPNWKEFRQPCKHIYAVTFSAQLRLDVEKDFKPSETSLDIVEIVECPKCKGNSIVKNGSRKCHKGTNQRYLCQDCGHRFVKDLELSRLKASTEVVCVCMDLYFKGNSLAKIKHHLKMFYQVEVSRPTIMRWVHKFSEILSNYSDRQTPPNIGDLWNSDEMMVNIREAGKDRNLEWIWNLMDSSTRFLLASTISKERRVEDAAKVLNQGKERAGKKPAAFITDGNKTYPEANRKVFYTNTAPTIHFRTPAHRKYFLNQNIERLNGTIRERVKVMRGLDGEDTGQVILDGERFYYNYIRPHMALDGRTPADMAGLQMPEGSLWSIYIKKALKT